jgi:two-component system, sensor histidine kinase and response regulator
MNRSPSLTIVKPSPPTPMSLRAEELFTQHQHQIYVGTDRMFAVLMLVQWLACIGAAFWLSPRAWSGFQSQIHLHVWAALILGGAITALPVGLVLLQPGRVLTRQMIAIAQMLYSALLIHLTGGRIETHFHVFGSLAFLAFYRDWRVLITASTVVAVDHYLRGMFWPQSVYGVLSASWLRSLEHAGWVVFEDIILIRWCFQGNREMCEIAQRTAELEAANARSEQTVVARTAELRDSEDFAKTILSTAHDAFVAMNGHGQITEWNVQAEVIFGWRRDEVLGKQLVELIVPNQFRDKHCAGLEKFLATGDGPALNQSIEISALARGGREFPVELTILPLELESGWLFSAFIRDITVRKQSEQELQHAKEAAESANRAKSEFLANMSHEIRTPLNGIVGMTDLALDTRLAPDQAQYLTTVKSCADSLLTVVNDILDFSKIEAGKLQMESISFELSDLLGDTCKSLGFRAHQKGLELACRIPKNVPDHLLGDPGRLRQVIVNLAGNAIKFTESGEVVIQVDVATQSAQEVVLRFTISDTGIGISPENQKRIFTAFEQADTSTTRNYGGTGLGLAIALKIVGLMDGSIWLESSEGRGSCFYFTARFEINRDVFNGKPDVPVSSLEGLRALVVDDNDTHRGILEDSLRNWRVKTTAACNASEGLLALEQAATRGEPFAAVFIDAQMPEIDGFALAKRMKSNPQLTGAVLMMLNSTTQLADAQRCRELGFATHLVKPFKSSELLACLKSAVQSATSAVPVEKALSTQPAAGAGDNKQCLNILLAEDNPVNQRVAVGILEKRGHVVIAVENGLQALKALKMQRFDLVLMDLQMPEMDGFSATAAIRQEEQTSGDHLPIVAMTARAMKGDRECCLEAGMDEYISKPVNPKSLLAIVEKAARKSDSEKSASRLTCPVGGILDESRANSPKETPPSDNEPQTLAAVDFADLLARVEDDSTLAEEMIELYLDSSPRLLAEIESGIKQQNPSVIRNAAHTLKGALQNLSADNGAKVALQLEQQGMSGEMTDVESSLAALKQELDRIQAELTEWSKGVTA